MNIRDLEPRQVWEQFEAITKVPRPSKKEERIIEFLIDFAKQHQLEWQRDDVGNVVIRKPATAGYEDHETVILQSHMDMVCEKNSDATSSPSSIRKETSGAAPGTRTFLWLPSFVCRDTHSIKCSGAIG